MSRRIRPKNQNQTTATDLSNIGFVCQKIGSQKLPILFKYSVMWKRIFLANNQVAQLGCSAGSIAFYVTGATAQLSGLEVESEKYVFM